MLGAMASTSPGPGLSDQQVMTAQSTNNPPQGVEAAVARMEGETAGPNYEGQQPGRPQLPNGVPHPSPRSSQEAEIQSLPYSPMRQGDSSGLLGEVWPTQPQGADGSRPEARGLEEAPVALRWMQRLGDFLRQHTAMEFTTTTRKRLPLDCSRLSSTQVLVYLGVIGPISMDKEFQKANRAQQHTSPGALGGDLAYQHGHGVLEGKRAQHTR